MDEVILKSETPSSPDWYQRSARAVIGWPDAMIAAALLTLGIVEALFMAETSPIWLQIPLTFAWTVPLAWRKRWPVAVLAIVIIAMPLMDVVNEQGGVYAFVMAAMLSAYTVGRELDRPRTWWGPVLTIGAPWAMIGAFGGELSDFVFVALLYGGAWGVGYIIRSRALAIDALTQQADELRRSNAERERLAVEQERTRIARELHDIVSHSISVITIQAQAVRHQLGPEHREQIDALRGIETTARQAMDEMRRMLGVLRASGSPLDLAPQPGLEQLPLLISEARAAGIQVDVSTEGSPAPVPAGIALAAYRVIQESLTNVRRHARVSTARVLLRHAPDAIEIQVDNDAPERAAASGEVKTVGGGHGLAGMRERVTLYGGTLSAGPTPQGGFRVHVTLPLASRETDES